MNHRAQLVKLVSQGASEKEIVNYFQGELRLSQYETYSLIEEAGIEFGRIGTVSGARRPDDGISEERRRYLQQLSLSDD